MLAAIEWGKLLQVVWVSLVAGVGITALFSLIIYGSTRAADARREGRSGQATAFGVLAGAASVAFAGAVIAALAIILNK